MSCCGVCRKPRYKRLIDSLFPEDPQDDKPVATNVDKFVYFAQSSPEDLDKMGKYLQLKLRKSLHREKAGHTQVALQVTEKLLAECEPRHLQLIADSYLNMLHLMLESPHTKMRIMATNSFVTFADREEGNTPYHRQYDSFIHHFASLSLSADHGNQELYQETRMAGLCGLRGVITKMGRQDVLPLNIWDIDHMNKIVPPFLFNMEDSRNGEVNLRQYAEEGLKELVTCAGLAHIDSVISPVLQHFDLNHLWTQQKNFSIGAFVTIVKTMQKQDRYKAIQALVQHLDDKAKESCDLKQGILDTLSQCVIVAADGSLGPSVLDVFRTLVKHLRISIQGPFVPGDELHSSTEDSQKFQKSITKTVGEFAGVLPDYHKPDIMSLINSYMVVAGPSADGTPPVILEATDQGYQLASSLVQCLKAVADTYHPAILDPTFPDALFTSLVQLFTIKNSSVQLDSMILWHQLIDHHDNRSKIPMNTSWESLEAQELMLGKVSTLFLKKTAPTIDVYLLKLAQNLSLEQKNLKAFYHLLFLIMLEFSEAGVEDMISYLKRLQAMALQSDLSVLHSNALHAVVAGILYLISKISISSGLQKHILEVIALRKASDVHLLPDTLFVSDNKSSLKLNVINDNMLFVLDEDRQSPEQKKGFGRFGRDSSSGPDLTSHFSVSLDYGDESPLSLEQINFNSLKDKVLSEEGRLQVEGSDHSIGYSKSLTFQEAVGKASSEEETHADFNLADMINVATKPHTVDISVENEDRRNSSAFDMKLPSLH